MSGSRLTVDKPSLEKCAILNSDIEPYPAIDALDKGFSDLVDLCTVVGDRFATARDDFSASKMEN
jgi:DNA-directed RNA polymerase I and III subunit RPAC2